MKKPYSGVLAEPMQYGKATIIDFAERYAALRDHYGLASSDDIGLALALACDHVPGFQFDQPAGRKLDQGAVVDLTILIEMMRAQDDGANVSSAARRVALRHPGWDMSWKTIRQRWYDMRANQRGRLRRLAPLLRLFRKL